MVVPPTPPGFSASRELGAAPEPPGPVTLVFLPVVFFLVVVPFLAVPPVPPVSPVVVCRAVVWVVVVSPCCAQEENSASVPTQRREVRMDFFIGRLVWKVCGLTTR